MSENRRPVSFSSRGGEEASPQQCAALAGCDVQPVIALLEAAR